MKRILPLILLLTSILCSEICSGQNVFEVPQNIELKTKEDYSKYEAAMVKAAIWLEQTDLDKEREKRKQVNQFVMEWVSGSPTVTIAITEPLVRIYGRNVELLSLYLANYAKNVIEHNGRPDKSADIKAGLMAVIKVYKKGIQVTKTRELEKIVRFTDSELDGYISDKFTFMKSA